VLSVAGRSVLVTGGAGFIGSHLIDRLLLDRPDNVVVVDNLFLGKRANLEPARHAFPGLRLYEEDAADFDAMREILAAEQVDVVFELAVVPLPTSLVRPRWTCDVNLSLATVACELLRQRCFQTLVHFSSSEVYGTARRVPMAEDHPLDPCTPYAASKAGADHVVSSYHRTFGLDVTTVRPFNGFGPRQNEGAYAGIIPIVIRRALAGEPVVVHGDGEQTRDFTFASQIAEAAVRAYGHPATRGRVVNVCSGREVSVNALVSTLLDIVQVEVAVEHAPPRPGDVQRHCGAAGLLEQLTGFRPAGGLELGLEETVRWYREQSSVAQVARAD
jgi:UDP-glucose 4-epimerase